MWSLIQLTQRKAVTTVSTPADIRTGYLSNTTHSVTVPTNVFGIESTMQHMFENFKGKSKCKVHHRTGLESPEGE
jgi:hypothetical protein